MANEVIKHSDCKNFSSVDVAKGICRLSNEIVFIDTPVCGGYKQQPKCKNCACFKNPNEDGIGTCTGMKKEYWSYEELAATNCEGYKEK